MVACAQPWLGLDDSLWGAVRENCNCGTVVLDDVQVGLSAGGKSCGMFGSSIMSSAV